MDFIVKQGSNSYDFESILTQIEMLNKQNIELENIAKNFQEQINANIKMIDQMQKDLQVQIRTMQIAQAKENISNKVLNFKNNIALKTSNAKSFIGNFKNKQIDKIKGYQAKIELAKQEFLQKQLEQKLEKAEKANERLAEKLQEQERKEILAQRKQDFEAALKEQRKEEYHNKIVNFKNAVQKISPHHKIGNFAKNKIQAFRDKKEEIEVKISTMIAKMKEDGKRIISSSQQQINNMETYFKQLSEERKIAKEIDKLQKETIENERLAEKLQEQERKEILAQRKQDFEAALKEQRIEEQHAKMVNFKNNVIQKTSSIKSKAGRYTSEKIKVAMSRTGNLDLKIKNALLHGEIELTTVKNEALMKYHDAKERGYEFTQEVLTKYREYQEQRRAIKEERLAEKLQEQERKEILAQRKQDFEEALKEQRKEEIKAKLTNFKHDVSNKVTTNVARVGNFKKSSIDKLISGGRNLTSKAQVSYNNLTNTIKNKANVVKEKITEKIDDFKDMLEELEKESELSRQIERAMLEKQYQELLVQRQMLDNDTVEMGRTL